MTDLIRKCYYNVFVVHRYGEKGGTRQFTTEVDAFREVELLESLGHENAAKHQHIEVWKITSKQLR